MTVLRSTTFQLEFKGQDGITGVKQFTRAVTDADSTVEQLNETLGDNATVTYKTTQSTKELTQQARNQATQIERNNRKVAELTREYNHMSSMVGKSADEQEVLNAQFRLGATATDKQRQEVAELVRAHQQLNAAQNKTQGSMRNTRGVAQNLGWQIQDTAVQLQMGTSAFVVLSQQGSQLASAFGPSGALIGALIAVGGAIAGVAFESLKLNDELDKLVEKEYDKIKLPGQTDKQLEGLTLRAKELREEIERVQKGEIKVEQTGFGAADVEITYGPVDTEKLKELEQELLAVERAAENLALTYEDLQNTVVGADLLDTGVTITTQEIQEMNRQMLAEHNALLAETAAANKEAQQQALVDDSEFYSEVERLRAEHQSKMQSIEDQVTALTFQLDPDASTLNTYLENQILIQSAVDAGIVSQKDAQDLSLQLYDQYTKDMSKTADSMVNSQLSVWNSFLGGMQSTMGQLAGLAEEGSAEAEALFYVTQGIAFANAIVSAHVAANKALEMGPILGIPASQAMLALGYANAGIIAGTTFAGAFDNGGFIPAGQSGIVSEYGDELVNGVMVKGPARVTSREDTAAMINGGGGGDVIVQQNITVSGNGDKALEQAMKTAAQQGAEMGAKKGYALVSNDFSTGRGIRSTLKKSIGV